MKSVLTRIIYTLILYFLVPLELIRLYWRGRLAPAYRLRLKERFALNLPDIKKGGVWVHTASVGEFLATIPVIKHLLESHPETPVIVTTMTPTGSELVVKEFGDRVTHVYVPFDLPDAVYRFLNHFQPHKILIMETELWPNIICAAHRRNIDIILMNARMSARSAKGYQRASSLTRSILQKITMVTPLHQDDAQRFLELGAKQSSIRFVGNIKYDLTVPDEIKQDGQDLRKAFPSELLWIAGSTHRGEDEALLDAHRLVRQTCPDAQLILVPRHPERFDEVADLCEKLGFSCSRRSLGQATDQSVYLGDTMGELLRLYAAADMAFVGGSLVDTGGHNLLEPAALAKPVMTGPYDFNFRDITRQMLESKAAVRILNAEQLAAQIIRWHEHPTEKQAASEQALAVVKNNQGALKKLLKLIES